MKVKFRNTVIFDGNTLDDLNLFVSSSEYDKMKNIKKLPYFDMSILQSEKEYTIIQFLQILPKFKTNVPNVIEYWIERGWSEEGAKTKVIKFKELHKKGIYEKIPKEMRIKYAMDANTARIKQIREMQLTGEYNRTNPTKIEHYLAKGLNQEEAQQALKDRQSTFSKNKLVEKFGEKEGMQKMEIRNKKWLRSLKENNDWDELSQSKAITLEKSIKKYGEEEGTERYDNWKNSVACTKENFIKRHGDELGEEKWNQYKHSFIMYVKGSQKSINFFTPILEKIKDKVDDDEIYIGMEGKREYWLKYKKHDLSIGTYFYDLTIRNLNIIIEFHGTHVHPNPKWDPEKWNTWHHAFTKQSATERREIDKQKKSLAENQGFKVLEIWSDDDNDTNSQEVLDFILMQLP